jgi:hypothetical protein
MSQSTAAAAPEKPSPWTWAWIAWLALFVVIEIPAAIKEHGSVAALKTLSRHVWFWFDGWKERVIFGAFWVATGAHLVGHASAWWLLTAIPFVVVVVRGVRR